MAISYPPVIEGDHLPRSVSAVCRSCNKRKLHGEFSKRAASYDGLQYDCKHCNEVSAKKKAAENKAAYEARPVDLELDKTCSRCRRKGQAILNFSKSRRSSDGYQPWCKDCYRDYASSRQTRVS